MKRTLLCTLLLAAFGLTEIAGAQQPYVVKGGERIVGSNIRAKRDGTIVLTLPNNEGSQEFPLGSYTRAVIEPPEDLRRGQHLLATGRAEEAIPVLEEVYRSTRFLTVDVYAAQALAMAEAELGKQADTVKRYEEMTAGRNRIILNNPLVKWPYLSALAATGQHDKVEPAIREAISSGSREDAARAQLLRGDLKLTQNKTRSAVLDYMRTWLLFRQQNEVMPEALWKIGEALTALRDQRAAEFYQELVDNHPNTPYGSRAQARLNN